MRKITTDTVLAALSHHIGKAQGIHVADLVSELVGAIAHSPYLERCVRLRISELRRNGVAICGRPRTGYYIAEIPEELEDACEFLRSRAMHSLELESKLRNIPLPELIGQLTLPT